MHFLLSKSFPGEKFLVIDADIVFAGKFLESAFEKEEEFDFAVSPEYVENAHNESFFNIYYNLKDLKKEDKNFTHPGYFFNAGQIVVNTTSVSDTDVEEFFEMRGSNWYKRLDLFPFYDQGILNYVLPKKEQAGQIKILKSPFMVWSETDCVRGLDFEKIKQGNSYMFLIHWAGALRIPYLSKMTRGDILSFFEGYYYEKVPGGRIKQVIRKVVPIYNFYLRQVYSSLRQLLRRRKIKLA